MHVMLYHTFSTLNHDEHIIMQTTLYKNDKTFKLLLETLNTKE